MPEIVLPSTGQARALTDRIKVAVEGTWLLIQEAYTSRAWAVLGYDTWDAYCAQEFEQTRLALPQEERQGVALSLRDSGLSTRAIGAATGVSHTQVQKDLKAAGGNHPTKDAGQGFAEFPPASVTGRDGKTYAAVRPSPSAQSSSDAELLAGDDWTPAEPAPEPKPKRRPLPEAFTEAGRDLTRATERLARLAEDDRFAKNRDTTRHQVPELLGALERTTGLIHALDLPGAQASEEARRWWATSLHKISDALRDVATSIEQEH